jgi:hypothetical protein
MSAQTPGRGLSISAALTLASGFYSTGTTVGLAIAALVVTFVSFDRGSS